MRDQMQLTKGIPFGCGKVSGTIFGGPFKNYIPKTRRLVGIKMAVEIEHPHDFRVDTQDYSVPSQEAMQKGIMYGLGALARGSDVYVGCMGGIGRTGLYMACMTKVMQSYHFQLQGAIAPTSPIDFVRSKYHNHAVETEEQQDFVQSFTTTPAVAWLKDQNRQLEPLVQVVEKPVYLGPIAWLLHLWEGSAKSV